MKCHFLVPFLSPVPEVHDLEGELHDVIDWIPFGLYLGIRLPELKTIEANYPTLQRRRIEMLQEWQNNATPTWSAVIEALVGIGMRRLASDLAQKHGKLKNDCYQDNYTIVHLQYLSTQELILPSCQTTTLWISWKLFFNRNR